MYLLLTQGVRGAGRDAQALSLGPQERSRRTVPPSLTAPRGVQVRPSGRFFIAEDNQSMRTVLLATFLLFGFPVTGSEAVLTFGVVPQQSASKLARLWTPILQHLGEKTGFSVRFRTAPDIPTFEKRLAAGEYDLAYMNPYHYTVFHQSPGYLAMARARDKRIRGILVVRKDSDIADLAGLEGSTLAFPAPAAFAATILAQSHLNDLGISYEPRYVSSHDSVYRAVAKGIYPAGGGVMRTLETTESEVRDALRVLWTSEGYTPHAIAAHPDTAQETLLAVQRALLAMETDTEGRKLLEPLGIKGFEAAVDSDWNDVRHLNIDRLKKLHESGSPP